jgi:hypothetical protein
LNDCTRLEPAKMRMESAKVDMMGSLPERERQVHTKFVNSAHYYFDSVSRIFYAGYWPICLLF